MVAQHGPFSLQTVLEGLRLHKTAFPTPMVRPMDESQGSSPLQGHGLMALGSCVKWPLVYLVNQPNPSLPIQLNRQQIAKSNHS